MVNRVLLRDFEVSEVDLERELMEQLGGPSEEAMPLIYVGQGQEFEPNKVIIGKVRDIDDDFVLVDVGYKSEGIIPATSGKKATQSPRRSARHSGSSSKTVADDDAA